MAPSLRWLRWVLAVVVLAAAPAAHADEPAISDENPGALDELGAPPRVTSPTTPDLDEESTRALGQLAQLTLVTSGAGFAGLLGGAIAGLSAGAVTSGIAAVLLKTGTLANAPSTLAIWIFVLAPALLGVAGGVLGWLVGRALVTAWIPSPLLSGAPRKRATTFAAVDGIAHVIFMGPPVLLAISFGLLMAVVVNSQHAYVGNLYFPSRRQVFAVAALGYGSVVAVALWPAALAALALFVPAVHAFLTRGTA